MSQPTSMSPAGLDLLKRSEGFRGFRYIDVNGNPTQGYGHKLRPGESYPVLTEPQAATILLADVRIAVQAVLRLVKVPLSQGQLDALADFTFNLGEGRLAASTLLKDLNAGGYASAGEQLLLWDHAGSVELEALRARREAEYNLWRGLPA